MKRILVVEDDPDLREAMKMLLEDHDFLVECAANGKEGFEILRAATELPNLILLDLMMPVMDGYTFRREQESDPMLASIPVVIVTASGDVESKRRASGRRLHQEAARHRQGARDHRPQLRSMKSGGAAGHVRPGRA